MAHVFRYELGGPAVHSGLVMKSSRRRRTGSSAEDVREAVNPPGDLHTAPPGFLHREHPQRRRRESLAARASPRGGRRGARAHGLSVHLDGARLMNAAVASGTPAAEYGREFDTVTLASRKGSAARSERSSRGRRTAWRRRGATSISSEGRCARPGSSGRRRLRARPQRRPACGGPRQRPPARGGPGRSRPSRRSRPGRDELRAARRGPPGLSGDEAVARLRAEGVLLSFAARKDVLRAVTHLDISADDIDEAIAGTVRAFSGSQRPVELAGDAPTPY